jgi:hypothetical protein
MEVEANLGDAMGPSGDGIRGGSEKLISFSNMFGVLLLRTMTGWIGRMPLISDPLGYLLGRLQDSNSASSRGVAARSEKPRILLLDRCQQKRTRVTTSKRTRVPRTAARMIQTFFSNIVSRGSSFGGSSLGQLIVDLVDKQS